MRSKNYKYVLNTTRRLRWIVYGIKLKSKCARCPESHPSTLQFAHRDPAAKTESISVMVNRGVSVKTLLAEIAKCDILCANCHFKSHWKEPDRPESFSRERKCKVCGVTTGLVKRRNFCLKHWRESQKLTMQGRRTHGSVSKLVKETDCKSVATG